MPWEVFAKEFKSKSTNPMLSISPLGRCTLNRAAAMMLDKEAVQTVLLLWDKEALKFAIRPIAKKDPRSFNIRYSRQKDGGKAPTGAAFSGVMFLKHIGYNFSETKSYPVTKNENEDIFEVTLPKERFEGEQQQPLVAVEGGKKHGKAVG